uniref:Fido domain-containing protein n=1 Tax=Ascaris lumbricoides TaxID=6252 RepID=A0A0M3IX45_ASCLU
MCIDVVFVGSFAPVAPELVPSEMEELIRWLNDEETLLLDPIEFAAIAHYKFVSLTSMFCICKYLNARSSVLLLRGLRRDLLASFLSIAVRCRFFAR